MNNTTFVCPHCGIEYDLLDLIETCDQEGEFDMPCVECGKNIHIEFSTEIKFIVK